MDTTAAAQQAKVTTNTIRTWCRIGALTATKAHGRWTIAPASLTRRLEIGTWGRTTPKPAAFSTETMTAIGGSHWTKNGTDRVYLNNWATFAGLDVDYYNTGNISGATYRGQAISNAQAAKLLGSIEKVWFDAADGRLHARCGRSESRVATQEELWLATVSGIRAAIAVL